MTARPAVAETSARVLTLLREPTVPPLGTFDNVSAETYHAWYAVSNTWLRHLRRSPAHLQAYIAGQVEDDTPAKDLGRAVHCAVLEPDLFATRYLIAERCGQDTKAKKRCEKWGSYYNARLGWLCGTHGSQQDQDVNVEVIGAKDHARVLKMRDAVYAHPKAGPLLRNAQDKELSIVWTDEATGVRCRCRWDGSAATIAGGVVLDLKKTRNASLRAFESTVHQYGYQIQAAHYLAGGKAVARPVEHFVNIAVEDEPPYAVGVYRVNEAALDAGEQERVGLLRLFDRCQESGKWPAYSDDVEDVSLPSYAFFDIDTNIRNLSNDNGS